MKKLCCLTLLLFALVGLAGCGQEPNLGPCTLPPGPCPCPDDGRCPFPCPDGGPCPCPPREAEAECRVIHCPRPWGFCRRCHPRGYGED